MTSLCYFRAVIRDGFIADINWMNNVAELPVDMGEAGHSHFSRINVPLVFSARPWLCLVRLKRSRSVQIGKPSCVESDPSTVLSVHRKKYSWLKKLLPRRKE